MVDAGAGPGRVFEEHGGVALDGRLVHRIRQLRRDGERVAEEEIQEVDAMRGDVVFSKEASASIVFNDLAQLGPSTIANMR